MFVGGAGWGFIPCCSVILSPSSCTLRACVRLCMRAWSVPLASSFVLLTYFFAIPLFPRGSWPSPLVRACACLWVRRGGVSYHVSPCSCVRLLSPCGLVYVCVCVHGPSLWRPPSHSLHTCSPYHCFPVGVVIPYSVSVCMVCGWGGGRGFIPCLSLTLSPSSFTLRPCVRLGMCAWFDPLVPSFVFLTYLFAIPLFSFPLGPWPPHTFCACFFYVPRSAWSLWRNGDIWVWFVFVRMLYDVRGSSSFVLLAALSLSRPPSQHTWCPHLRMCSGGNVGCMGSLHTCLSYLCFPVVHGCGRVVVFCAFFVFGLVSLLLFCCLLFFFDAHKSPSSYGTHFARWFGAGNVEILHRRGSLVLGVLCVS